MKRSPEKANWLSAGDTYAVHLMPPLAPREGVPVPDAANHAALQVRDLHAVLARLLESGQHPYQLSLSNPEPRYVQDPHDKLTYGLGTLFVNDPDGNVLEFVDVTKGIFAEVNYKVED
jgi:hypothetical protein